MYYSHVRLVLTWQWFKFSPQRRCSDIKYSLGEPQKPWKHSYQLTESPFLVVYSSKKKKKIAVPFNTFALLVRIKKSNHKIPSSVHKQINFHSYQTLSWYTNYNFYLYFHEIPKILLLISFFGEFTLQCQ